MPESNLRKSTTFLRHMSEGASRLRNIVQFYLIASLPFFLLLVYRSLNSPELPEWNRKHYVEEVNEAIDSLSISIAKDPRNVQQWVDLGWVFAMHSGFPQAISCFSHAIALDPSNAQWSMIVGCIKEKESSPAAGLQDYADAYNKSNGQNALIALAYINALLDTGDFSSAEPILRNLEKSHQQPMRVSYALGRCLLLKGEDNEALNYLREAQAAAPSLKPIALILAQTYGRLGEVAKSEEQLKKSLKCKQTRLAGPLDGVVNNFEVSSDVLRLKAQTLFQAGNLLACKNILAALCRTNQNDLPLFLRYIEVLIKLQEYDAAQQILIQIESKTPGICEVAYLLATCQAKTGKIAQAEQTLRGLIAKCPNQEFAWTALAQILIDMNSQNDAIELLQSCTEHNPRFFTAKAMLKELLAD